LGEVRVSYGRILRDAWTVATRTWALWWLGVISALQAAVLTLVITSMTVPLTLIPTMATALASGPDTAESNRFLFAVTDWISGHLAVIVAVVVAVYTFWLALAIVDVAAQTGIVSQVDAVAEGKPASVRAGLRDGFRLWWRAVALLSIAMLPGLIILLAVAIVMFLTVSLPLLKGQPPSPALMVISNQFSAPLSSLISAVTIPLAILAGIALRYAVIDDIEWRPSLRASWQLIKVNLAEVAITYVLLVAITLPVIMVFGVVVLAIAGVAGAATFGVTVAFSGGTDAAIATAFGAAFATAFAAGGLLFVAFQAAMFVWQSCVWTIVWRNLTGRAGRGDSPGETVDTRGAAALATEEDI
jgi:hypothetical protein